MKLIRFGIAGFLIQIGALWAFILISRTDYAPFGKPLAIVLATCAECAMECTLWVQFAVSRPQRNFRMRETQREAHGCDLELRH